MCMTRHIEVKEYPSHHTLAVKARTDQAHIAADIGRLYGELFGYIGLKGIGVRGAPYVEYLAMGPDGWDIEAGVPVAPGAKGEGGVVAKDIPAGQCVYTMHIGPYDTLKGTYDEIDAWLKANGYEYAGAPRETYHSDPVKEKDASKWRTEIVWPVKKK